VFEGTKRSDCEPVNPGLGWNGGIAAKAIPVEVRASFRIHDLAQGNCRQISLSRHTAEEQFALDGQ
jgi:hypothetical protein